MYGRHSAVSVPPPIASGADVATSSGDAPPTSTVTCASTRAPLAKSTGKVRTSSGSALSTSSVTVASTFFFETRSSR